MTDKEKIRREIEKRYEYWREKEHNSHSIESETRMSECQHLLLLFNSLQEEPVSKDLEEAANTYIGHAPEVDECSSVYGKRQAFKAGAKWQKEHPWKPADGDDLPEIDKEVIALLSNGTVVYAHRPQEYWDGKNIATGEVTRHYPVRHDKGGWNIPDVKFWLDCELPKMEE